MAKVQIRTTIEGNIDKYDAFKALCEEVGLKMLTQDNLGDYKVKDGILYRYVDGSYHGSSLIKEEIVSKDYRLVALFESLLTIKSLL